MAIPKKKMDIKKNGHNNKSRRLFPVLENPNNHNVVNIRGLLEVAIVILALGVVIGWNGNSTVFNSIFDGINSGSGTSGLSLPMGKSTSGSIITSRRFLSWSDGNDNNKPNDIDDDITRDDTCKAYLRNFLNGTTDATDECVGMYNAYQAADCVDEKGDGSSKKKKKKNNNKNNDTTADDDVTIDDFYENWECCSSIYDYYSSKCQDTGLDSARLLGIVIVLVACGFVKSLIKTFERLHFIPDAAACIVVGSIAGIIVKLFFPGLMSSNRLTFNNDLFLHILLPPIVFQAALTIDKKSFRRDLFPILSFAIIGTFASAVMIGFITYYLSALGTRTNAENLSGGVLVTGGMPLIDSMLFGSLISSIDPVATLGILASVGVSQRDTLYTLVFGESLLNDGVAIVLFDTLVKHLNVKNADADPTALFLADNATLGEILYHFVIVAAGSIGIGLACGVFCTIYFNFLKGKHSPVTEVAIFFTWALIPFYLADGLYMSGIISVMVMGFVLDYFVIGGFQSDDSQWMDYIEYRCNQDGLISPDNQDLNNTLRNHQSRDHHANLHTQRTLTTAEQIYRFYYKTFNGKGHLLNRSRQHVGFVAEVISTIMETAIFAYLGLFLLFNNDNHSTYHDSVSNTIHVNYFKLNVISIFSCVLSRAIMILVMSAFINLCVWLDLENLVCNRLCGGGFCWACCFDQRGGLRSNNNHAYSLMQSNNNSTAYDSSSYNQMSVTEDGEYDDDYLSMTSSGPKIYLDYKTQFILLLSGVRGAVSFALVCNIPVYDAVTKEGSMYKAQLKAMTSTSILFTIFIFGALTYYMVHHEVEEGDGDVGSNFRDRDRRVVGRLTHRLLSGPLASESGSVNEGAGALLGAGDAAADEGGGYRNPNFNEISFNPNAGANSPERGGQGQGHQHSLTLSSNASSFLEMEQQQHAAS